MSQVDEGSLQDAAEEQGEIDDVKLVPVGESIRYRKRAQSAERRVEELAGELSESRAEALRLAEELKAMQKDQELTRRLAAAGAMDLEAATLIAKSRLAREDAASADSVVEQLKKEKQYLFAEKVQTGMALRTSPAKEQRGAGTGLERAAKRAAGTGNRADLQEYMKKRRSLM
jgi:hypothetical protein